ncbi:MAG: N-methyl-D-aspartate receptor NMDAR2C subunit [archaeon]
MSEFTGVREWLRMWSKDDEASRLVKIHNDLVERYNESNRYYHNLSHISSCLSEFSLVCDLAVNPFEVWLALWFHDCIYDPHRRDNEEQSAMYLVKAIKGLFENTMVNRISELILATKHCEKPKSLDMELVMDVDLVILGKPTYEFKQYEKNIRREYEWLSWEKYARGREIILRKFLERDCIYHTGYFREKYETKARSNLMQSIKKLKVMN